MGIDGDCFHRVNPLAGWRRSLLEGVALLADGYSRHRSAAIAESILFEGFESKKTVPEIIE